jgi:hypothetical protein
MIEDENEDADENRSQFPSSNSKIKESKNGELKEVYGFRKMNVIVMNKDHRPAVQ